MNALQGDDCIKKRDYPMAIKFYLNALEAAKNPDNRMLVIGLDNVKLEKIFLKLGEAYFCMNDVQNAMISYEEGLKFDPKNPDILVGVANVAFKNRQFETAKKVLQNALSLNPAYTQIQQFINDIDNIINQQNSTNSSTEQNLLNIELPNSTKIMPTEMSTHQKGDTVTSAV
jgi:tetratricopeptide (TPR) repeat protein